MTERTVYVGNIGKEVDNTTLGHLFQHCGPVLNIRIAGEPTYETRYAFVEFGTDQAAETALLLDGMDVFGRKIRVNFARGGGGPGIVRSNDPDRVTRTVHIGGFPMEDVNEEQLAEYFSHVGEVLAVRKSGRFAWIEFSTLKAAQQALQLDGEIMGNGTLKVQQSKTPIMSAGWRAPPKLNKAGNPIPLPSAVPTTHLIYPAAPATSAPPFSPPAEPSSFNAPTFNSFGGAPASSAPPAYSGPPPTSVPFPGPPPVGAPTAPPPGPRPPPGPPPPHLAATPPTQYPPPPAAAGAFNAPPQGPPPASFGPPPAGGTPQSLPGPPPLNNYGAPPPSSGYAPPPQGY